MIYDEENREWFKIMVINGSRQRTELWPAVGSLALYMFIAYTDVTNNHSIRKKVLKFLGKYFHLLAEYYSCWYVFSNNFNSNSYLVILNYFNNLMYLSLDLILKITYLRFPFNKTNCTNKKYHNYIDNMQGWI